MKRASCSCCNFLCVVHAATYLKYRRYRLSCLPFVWHFLSLWHTHTHTHTHTRTHSLVQWNWFSDITGCMAFRCIQWRQRTNRGLFQRLSGFDTGHPAAASSLPAFDFSVSDEQDAAFLVSVMDYSDCDSSGLDSPNSSWSMARLKEYLRRKKRPSKRGKKAELLERDYLHRHRHLESFFVFFFVLLFFSLYLVLFSSSSACYASYFSSTGT